MNVAIINVLAKSGSTGKISYSLYQHLKKSGHKVIICYGRRDEAVQQDDTDCYRINTDFELYRDALEDKLLNRTGLTAVSATRRLVNLLESQHVQVVYLFNIHDHFINQQLLFDYMASRHIRVIYDMIDEYAFLGTCCYAFDCEQYKTFCQRCPRPENMFSRVFNRPGRIYAIKKRAYEKLKGQLFFVGIEYTVRRARKSALVPATARFVVLDEAVDLRNLYYPRQTLKLRQRLGISEEQKVCLLVAPSGNPRKGTRYFMEAARLMERSTDTVFVHVGYADSKRHCPPNFKPVGFVKDQNELAEYYSMADVFVCTSLAETIPAACLEALSCGTPLIGFDISGVPYCADKEHGTWVEPCNVSALAEAIRQSVRKTEAIRQSCREYAISRFDAVNYNIGLEKIMYIANENV